MSIIALQSLNVIACMALGAHAIFYDRFGFAAVFACIAIVQVVAICAGGPA